MYILFTHIYRMHMYLYMHVYMSVYNIYIIYKAFSSVSLELKF